MTVELRACCSGRRQLLRSANSIFADSNSVASRNKSLAVRLSVLATRSAFERAQIGNGSLGHLSCMRSDRFLADRIPQFESRHYLTDVAEISRSSTAWTTCHGFVHPDAQCLCVGSDSLCQSHVGLNIFVEGVEFLDLQTCACH